MDLRTSDIPLECLELKSAVVTELELSDCLMPNCCGPFYIYLGVEMLINMMDDSA
jgi:hypothetical protein